MNVLIGHKLFTIGVLQKKKKHDKKTRSFFNVKDGWG
jgi:hypothetical protein